MILPDLHPQDTLTEAEQKRGEKLVIRDGVATQIMQTCTAGAFVVAFALSLGASHFQVGIIAAIPTFANVCNLLSIYLVQRFGNRRKIVVAGEFAGRTIFLLIAFLPLLANQSLALALLLPVLCVRYFVGATGGGGWSSWMRDLIPEARRGEFFARRMRNGQVVGVGLSLLCAAFLDYVKDNYPDRQFYGYSVLFMAGSLAGLYGVYCLARTPEPRMPPIVLNMRELLKLPFKNRNFRNLIWYMASWNFAVNLAAPFFTVYLLQTIGLNLSYVIGLTVLNQLTNIFFLRFWGEYSDKFSNTTILRVCIPLFLLCFVGWTFTTMPDTHPYTLPLLVVLHVAGGIATAGINLASNTIGLKLAPADESVAYLSTLSLVNSAAAGLAPLIGGMFADYFAYHRLTGDLTWESPEGDILLRTIDLQGWDFFFILACIAGLFAMFRLSYVQEGGHVGERVLLAEVRQDLMRNLRNVSTLTGVRTAVNFPFAFFRMLSRRPQE